MPTLSVGRALLVVSCSASLAACSLFHESDADQASVLPAEATPEAVVQGAIVPTIVNPSFEQKWEAWDELPDGGDYTAISNEAQSGEHSAKITEDGGRFEQTVAVQPNTSYQISAFISGAGEIGIELPGETLSTGTESDDDVWSPNRLTFNTGDATEVVIFGAYGSDQARFDDFAITLIDG